MSSLSRRLPVRHAAALAMASALAMFCVFDRPAAADEINFVPFATVTGEWDSNRLLERPPASAGSYGGLVGAEVRDLTQRAYMDLVTQIYYTDVPQLGSSWTSGNAAFRSDFKTLYADYTLLAAYRHDDSYYTEFGHAAFDNDLTPTSPDTNVTTANVTTGITRESYELDPGFDYNMTERLDLEGDFHINSVRYSVQTPGQLVDYTSPYAGLTLNYDTSPRSSIGIGPYFSRYQETGGTNTTDTDGLSVAYLYKTSNVTRMEVTLRVERNHIDMLDFSPQSVTSWGLEWVGTHKYQVGSVQFSIGRFLEPSSVGGRVALNQFRVQYNRPLSARLSVSGAVRVTSTQIIGNGLAGEETPEHRTNAELNLHFDMTPTWFVQLGYIFARSRDLGESDLAYSNGALLSVGYRGLEPPLPRDTR
jgi:hypothetical protein